MDQKHGVQYFRALWNIYSVEQPKLYNLVELYICRSDSKTLSSIHSKVFHKYHKCSAPCLVNATCLVPFFNEIILDSIILDSWFIGPLYMLVARPSNGSDQLGRPLQVFLSNGNEWCIRLDTHLFVDAFVILHSRNKKVANGLSHFVHVVIWSYTLLSLFNDNVTFSKNIIQLNNYLDHIK